MFQKRWWFGGDLNSRPRDYESEKDKTAEDKEE
jgi:hypothetical protein